MYIKGCTYLRADVHAYVSVPAWTRAYVTVSILYLSITFNYDVSPRKGFFETLNGRLPLQISSVWLQTLSKRVSDDPQHFIFRRRRFCFRNFPDSEIRFLLFLSGY